MDQEKRYELRGFARGGRNGRGPFKRVETLTIQENDPHAMAIHVWRLERTIARGWRYEVVDLKAGRRNLAPVVSYEELLRRAGSKVAASK